MQDIRKGGEIELYIEKLAFGGKAIGRRDGYVVFVEHALPGQHVRVRIIRKKRQYAEGYVTGVISPSPRSAEPFCQHFGVCGGCLWQDLPYEDQLHWKRLHVLDCLEHLTGIEEATVEPTIPSPHTMWYRNKMEFTFSDRRWLSPEEIALKEAQYSRSFALGLHVRGSYDKIFDVENCYLESPKSVEIVRETRDWCRRSGLLPYSTKTHQGFWRFLVIREAKHTGQAMVHLLTTDEGDFKKAADSLATHLTDRFPEITSFIHSVSQKKAQVASGESSRNLVGPSFIEERLDSLRFRISAHSFFQTNPYGASRLFDTISRFGEFTGKERVWDLYCGTGSIALFISAQVHEVTGFEIVEDAVNDAYVNGELNGIKNCHFRVGDLKDMIKGAHESRHGGAPDVVITDPPRAGMHPRVSKALLELAPRRIIAVSCNPATLARDLVFFLEHYEVRQVQPFDLFPHTPHIECVVRLDRKT